MLGVGLDEFIYLFKYRAVWLLATYWNSHDITEIIISTE